MMPELAATIAAVETPYSLWFALWDAFRAAYDEPLDHSLIARIDRQNRSPDLNTPHRSV
jgi:hypothetical protein